MRDAGVVAVAAGPAEQDDLAGVRGADRRAGRDGDVPARVQAAPALAERGGDRPVDGPDQLARARPDRTRRRRARGGGEARGDPRLLALEHAQVALERVPALARRGERALLARPHALDRRAAVDEAALDGCDLVAPGDHLARDLRLPRLQLVEPLGRRGRLGLGRLDAADDARVLGRHALDELRPLEQLGEAVGLEDHRHDVRLVGLVDLHQALAEHDPGLGEPRPQASQPDPLLAQPLLDPRELGELGVEVGLDPRLPVLQHVDVGLEDVDPARVAGDRGRQDALAPLLGLDLPALGVDLARQGRRRPAREHRQEQPETERHRHHQEQEAQAKHAAGHARPRERSRPPLWVPATNRAPCRAFGARAPEIKGCSAEPPRCQNVRGCHDPPHSARTPGSRSG